MNGLKCFLIFMIFSFVKCSFHKKFTTFFLPTSPSPSGDSKFEISCSGTFTSMEVLKHTTSRTIPLSSPGEASADVSDLVEYMNGNNHTTNSAITIKLAQISSDDQASCMGIANNTYGSDSFLFFRNGRHDLNYIVQTFCDAVGVCQFAIVTTGETNIEITFPKQRNFSNPACSILYKNVLYGEHNLTIREQFPTDSVIQIQATCDLTGTLITSDDPIAVFSGSHSIIVGWGDTTDFMMSQLLPVKHWGTEYVVYPYPNGKSGDIISIVTEHDKTEIHITGYGSYYLEEKHQFLRRRIENDRPVRIWASKEVGVAQYIHDIPSKSSAMLIVAPTNQYLSDISILNYGIFSSAEAYLSFTEDSNGFDVKVDVKKSIYFAGKLQNPASVNQINFGGYVVTYNSGSILTATSVGYGFNNQGSPSKPSVPGDQVDNDGDEEIDEDTQCTIENWQNRDCSKLNLGTESLNTGKEFIIPMIMNAGETEFFNSNNYVEEMITSNCTRTYTTSSSNPENTNISSDAISVIFTGNSSLSISAFTAFPMESLGLNYFAFTYCQSGMSCNHSCSIAAAYDGTQLFVRGYGTGSLAKARLFTFSGNNDISGTYIKANNPIAVTCGIITDTTVSQFQLPSDDTWGKTYRIIFQEADSGIIRLMTSDGNTVVTLMEYEYVETDPIDTKGIILNKTYTYRTVYAIVDPGETRDITIENNTVYHLEANRPILVVYIPSTSPYPFIIVGSSYANSQTIPVPGSDGTSCQTVQIPYALLDDEKFFIPYRKVEDGKISSWWLKVNETVTVRNLKEQPHSVSEQVPGDQIDNDGDGLVDEDFCGFLVTELDGKSFLFDIDIDGALNEDCKGCAMGEELDEYLQCTACEIGTYRDAVGIDICINCPTNYTTFFENSNSSSLCVEVCFEGYEYNATTASCKECSVGYFKEGNSSDWKNYNFTERWNCTQCPDLKTTLKAGTVYEADCTGHCDAGYEKKPFTSGGSCEKCQYGWYKNFSSNSSRSEEDRWLCKECSDNKTTMERGTDDPSLCLDACMEGYELENDTRICVPCAIGFYKDVSSLNTTIDASKRWWCQKCPDGKTTLFNASTTEDDCLDNCEAGDKLSMYSPQGTCEPCDYGWYKTYSSSDVNITAAERWNCTQCPEELTTMYRGSTTDDQCLPICTEGYEFDNATKECRPCATGFYKEVISSNTTASVTDRWWCRQCESGNTTMFNATMTRNDCLKNCIEGKELSVYNPQGTCKPCDHGWYKMYNSRDVNITAAERWNCTQCPSGNTTMHLGATSLDQCVPLCLEGYQFNSTTEFCDKCPKGSFKNISGNLQNCLLCPNNLTTTRDGAYKLSQCHREKCKCPCNLVGNPAKANLSVEEKAEILENHVKELKVDKKKLSSAIRKKISAADNRPSSSAFGGLGILMITLAVALLIFFDATTLRAHFIMFYHNLKAIMGRG